MMHILAFMINIYYTVIQVGGMHTVLEGTTYMKCRSSVQLYPSLFLRCVCEANVAHDFTCMYVEGVRVWCVLYQVPHTTCTQIGLTLDTSKLFCFLNKFLCLWIPSCC